ncbi:heavy metal sensor kinase [Roseimicrobium gellanilyticum]|uniref:histidine kinase n=1 Tax=Roseimicrobium gellanilyticum TaxID=748857 RepID=A0A366H1J4_9BACT|nr:ATP-binding protein [Roseimicrobium gellanilyticum]RBP35638.1 heavy metal sensor kinase [Roseimicrobium gellanilyticum]
MKRLSSIRVRLVGLIGLLLFVVLGGFGYMAWHRESVARIAAVDRALEERFNILISGFRPEAGQRVDEVSEPRLSPRARELFANGSGEDFYYVVWRKDGSIQARSQNAPEISLPAQTSNPKEIRERGVFRELVHFTPTGRCFVVGRNLHKDLDAMQADAGSLAVAGTAILLIGLALAWWIASSVTGPLQEVSRTAKQIAAGDLSQRINKSGPDDELGELVKVLNETFSRLEAAFSRQKQFTADASHELRTPVSLILAHAQGALLREQTPADYREALTDCVLAAQRMKALIESLLDLARFDADVEEMRLEPCDLAVLTRECTEQLRLLADSKTLRLNLDLQAAPCHGDSVRLKQVISNLVVNAIHFTPAEGGITLTTSGEQTARFSIIDTGPGIDAAQLPLIFERFRRSDASRTRATGGTGLGLAICKAIVEAHGGTIAVDSELRQGTKFIVDVPLRANA